MYQRMMEKKKERKKERERERGRERENRQFTSFLPNGLLFIHIKILNPNTQPKMSFIPSSEN